MNINTRKGIPPAPSDSPEASLPKTPIELALEKLQTKLTALASDTSPAPTFTNLNHTIAFINEAIIFLKAQTVTLIRPLTAKNLGESLIINTDDKSLKITDAINQLMACLSLITEPMFRAYLNIESKDGVYIQNGQACHLSYAQ